jgi:beta-phosphoglucomutase-like phosphatase (HAD superfamily)
MSGSLRAVLFDVDGTLVDTNYLHADAAQIYAGPDRAIGVAWARTGEV